MRRYARLDPPAVARGRPHRAGEPDGPRDLLVLPDRGPLGRYFVLEGFDFGVGMLLPFLPRDEDERGTMLETIGPVWDGNEVWLVVAARRDVRGVPGLVRDDVLGLLPGAAAVLVLLIVRVVSFEWREQERASALAARVAPGDTVGSFGAPFLWGVALANLVHGVPLDSDGDFAGSFARPLQRLHRAAGVRPCAVRAARRDLPHAAHPGELATGPRSRPGASRPGGDRRRCLPLDGRRRGRPQRPDVFPTVLPAALGVAALAARRRLRAAGRSGWAFVMTARRDGRSRRDDLHGPVSAGARVPPGFGTASRSRTRRPRTTP